MLLSFIRWNKLYNHVRNDFYSEVVTGVSVNAILLFLGFFQHQAQAHRPDWWSLGSHPCGEVAGYGLHSCRHFPVLGDWDDLECKSGVSLHRLMRGFSICAGCLLSIPQAISLSSGSSHLAKFKHKSPHHNLYSLLLLGVFYAFISGQFFLFHFCPSQRDLTQSCISH